MSRVIKFRAFNGKQMLSWEWIVDMGFVTSIVVNEFDTYKTMQFTGLIDKNGTEIYEGDIVKLYANGSPIGNLDVVEFKNGCFVLRYRDRTLYSWIVELEIAGEEAEGEIEVVGNIFQTVSF